MKLSQREKRHIRLLFICNTWEGRGAEQQLSDLRRSLPERIRTDIFIFTMHDNGLLRFINQDSTHIPAIFAFRRNRLFKSLALLMLLTKNRYDVVVTEGLGSALFFGRMFAMLCGVPVIYSTQHTYENLNRNDGRYFEPLNMLLNRILLYFRFKRALRFLPVFNGLAERLRAQVPKYPIDTLWNAISENYINRLQTHVPSNNVRLIREWCAGCATVIHVGTLDRNKNHIFMLKCIHEIREKVPNVRYIIVGEGPERSRLVSFVEKAGLSQHVQFSGQIGRMDCLYLIKHSKIMVLTSFSEAFPNVFLEAQICSIPIVSFAVGGASEVILDGETGFLTPMNSVSKFNNRVVDLLTNPDLAKKMGERGNQHFLDHFTMNMKSEKLVSLIESDLTRRKKKEDAFRV
jgi:glycosyltransferase involved in cell wall biosynthesis